MSVFEHNAIDYSSQQIAVATLMKQYKVGIYCTSQIDNNKRYGTKTT